MAKVLDYFPRNDARGRNDARFVNCEPGEDWRGNPALAKLIYDFMKTLY